MIYDGWDSADLGLGAKKLSYYTHKKMTETLEDSDWNNIQINRESGDVYIYKFTKYGSPLYVAGRDYVNDPPYPPGKTIQVPLAGLQRTGVIVTEALPKYASGTEVIDYSTAFNTTTLLVSNGTATLNLGDSPVW